MSCPSPKLRQADKSLISQLRSGDNPGSMITLFLHVLRLLPFLFGGYRQLAVENLALRQQLAAYKGTTARPKLRTTDRLFWIWLARVWAGWKQPRVIVTADTVCGGSGAASASTGPRSRLGPLEVARPSIPSS